MAKRSRATEDFISHLPVEITDDILLRLPLQEAVRTSILSKNWRYKWTTRPELRFERSTFSSASESKSELLTITHQVLLQHQGPISKFLLDLSEYESCPEIDHLISFLSTKGIEEFTLYAGETHTIPSYLFSCLKLKSLKTLVLSFPSPLTTRCTLRLIESSPNLQKLVMDWTLFRSKEDNVSEIQFSKLKESPDFSLEKLQSIEMSGFSGLWPQMAFVEFLLAKSPMLKTMNIYPLKGWSKDEKFTAILKIIQVPRASPRAKVIFLMAA